MAVVRPPGPAPMMATSHSRAALMAIRRCPHRPRGQGTRRGEVVEGVERAPTAGEARSSESIVDSAGVYRRYGAMWRHRGPGGRSGFVTQTIAFWLKRIPPISSHVVWEHVLDLAISGTWCRDVPRIMPTWELARPFNMGDRPPQAARRRPMMSRLLLWHLEVPGTFGTRSRRPRGFKSVRSPPCSLPLRAAGRSAPGGAGGSLLA